ncbi:hypothetical protein BT67DRAFT_496799 [Trichocladium antarcticum]|uniref:Transcription factor IIIC putative zinc-finger domain-containing protein n=1 Tax=Trichocladium antarcticum TaxID=1450529 RepID=A0AAN6UJI2_9PEZI|nr:hypothetical protein BT67DRAFT_496799 [Trichocladium antarcticum]
MDSFFENCLRRNVSLNNSLTNPQFLPLREITLNSRPLVKRAIQFSCDGDLAVAADDSVHIFAPEFPDFSKRRAKRKALAEGRQNGASHGNLPYDDLSCSDDEEEESDTGPGRYNRQTIRAQYSEGSKHMPVSYPPLDPRVNRELFAAAQIPFPYEDAVSADADGQAQSDDSNDGSVSGSDASDSEGEDGDAAQGFNRPYGAGYGPITGVGSSMNHVVSVGWSPSGLGVNRRPILAVLTGSGTLVVYGDGSEFANILPRANDGMLQRRELNSWVVLWGVGERLLVPGQQTKVSEYIRSFAWAREIAPGQALLATVNDVKEVAIISVQSVLVVDDGKTKGDSSFRTEPRENSVWLVREIARFKADGPHEASNLMDPDYVPCGTSFGLRWGPWLETGNSRTCVLSFVDRNYVGFRSITIKEPWVKGEVPSLEVGDKDTYGKCLHLSTDVFVEFEDGTWAQGPVSSCRGIIAAGLYTTPFEVALAGGPVSPQEKHSAWDCGTVYNSSVDRPSHNPIVDLVIHPPDVANPTPTPLYTLIRMSATATTDDWYETNVPPPSDPAADSEPQWVRSVAQKLDVQVPVDMYRTRGYDDDSDSDGGSSGSDQDMDDFDSVADEDSVNGDEDNPVTLEVPQIHPHRFRLHGLTLSPGGGVAAVLASNHSTQHPERGGWHTIRSNILFGHKPRRRRRLEQQQHSRPVHPEYNQLIDPEVMDMDMDMAMPSHPDDTHHTNLTTEAKLFEHLYGGGPEVPGVHYPTTTLTTELLSLFAPVVATQKCDLCGSQMNIRNGPLSGCEKGHFFGTCATSGLAVQTPGGTRSCGACGLRTMRAEVLVAKMPAERREEIRRLVGDGVCGACGGKFLS